MKMKIAIVTHLKKDIRQNFDSKHKKEKFKILSILLLANYLVHKQKFRIIQSSVIHNSFKRQEG